MHSSEIIDRVRAGKEGFGVRCSKFVGAVAVEVLRCALKKEGIPVSQRDCFIRGIPIEIDLLVAHEGVKPCWEMLYEPDDVRVALEVKQVGAFPGTIEKVRGDFARLSSACPHISCAYVAIEERRGYKLAVTSENCGYPAFTLATYSGSANQYELTNDWERLLAFIRNAAQSSYLGT